MLHLVPTPADAASAHELLAEYFALRAEIFPGGGYVTTFPDPAVFVGNALSPAKVVSVTVVDAAAKAARVIVPDYQLSLAIGKEGQNARLAARLTGWRIDIRSDAAPAAEGGPE